MLIPGVTLSHMLRLMELVRCSQWKTELLRKAMERRGCFPKLGGPGVTPPIPRMNSSTSRRLVPSCVVIHLPGVDGMGELSTLAPARLLIV